MINQNKLEIIEPRTVWIGEEKAELSLVMYGDYESEACAKAQDVIDLLLKQYDGRIRFQFRHFPLTRIHQFAHKAAEAAVAAVQEGKFWEMHHLLFAHRKRLGSISLKEYALEAGVKDKNFIPKLVDSVYGWTVRADLLEGVGKGVRDVPALFINDQLYEGKFTQPALSKTLLERLPARKKRA
ncbi:thioredoxin domain-containing protein [Flavihumibacter sp. ZG627]|uniref:DsbA family protein n=1 Tax=Flavihumibacter sp. ZG627 TaxID=1463156 RepID=UPI00057CCF66|nr:thioredoxin domain-containing protein [Flavihumibacter sp. ZG627]KIC91608.1 DSBA oxidoreductase [Flavihumibacter sp. ZG627]